MNYQPISDFIAKIQPQDLIAVIAIIVFGWLLWEDKRQEERRSTDDAAVIREIADSNTMLARAINDSNRDARTEHTERMKMIESMIRAIEGKQ